ncbi:hypothetical protein ACFC1R_13845 [Kitasatospora sp. NPDC056138]|uniref:hypothetical protein n=1 Tax=Kitasatospora sp. NPDC056138 TaxID=3345724 RepID=UPI0035D72277
MFPADALPAPDFDPVAGLPELVSVRQLAEARDWPGLRELFGRLTDEHGRCVAAGIVGEVPDVEQFLAHVVRQDADPLAATLLANRRIVLGWQARTDSRAKDVTADQWVRFREHLNHAEQLLIRVTAHRPDFALAWAARLTVAMGLSLGLSESRRRYQRLTAYHPHHFVAQSRRLQQLLPKWGGKWEDAHAFALECLAGAPDGALSGALLAEYHIERWLDLGRGDKGAEYLRQPHVRAELADAAHRSVLHPACRARYGIVGVHGEFAMATSLAGELAQAARHFGATGGFASRFPWDYLPGDARANFIEHRERALAKG